MTTGKFKFIIFIVLAIIIGSACAIFFKVKRDKIARLLSNPKPGQIYTLELGSNNFQYFKVKSFTKDSICFYLCNYRGANGDVITDIKENKDAFSTETFSYSRAYLNKIFHVTTTSAMEDELFDINEVEE